MIFREKIRVISNEEISEGIFKTTFKSSSISSIALPGQFINILPEYNWSHVMRRPMSIASQGNSEISIIYKPIGDGTQIMANWKKGDLIDVIGPLGNYWNNYKQTFPILIGGGVGIAPILNFHNYLNEKNINHILIMGAKNDREHFLHHAPNRNIYMSTDDGSLGIKGNVVDVIKFIYKSKNLVTNTKLFSCGPPKMMESVKTYAIDNNILCDLALETIMACGIGICQGCTIEKHVQDSNIHSYRNRFSLACIDGPIFNAKDIVTCM
tara:strand:- start:627 stop:1427 length:801 start_codon:yes stop_codon:yes gene_type:complete